jgi:transcription termination factor Rho
VAAEALEQSMLESKDKDQLLAIAQALGIKTTARAAKATLIAKILETTGVGNATPEPTEERTESAEPQATVASAAAPAAPAAQERADADADADGDADGDDDGDDDDSDGDADGSAEGQGDGESRNARRRRRRRNKNRAADGAPAPSEQRVEPRAEPRNDRNDRNDRAERNDRNERNDRHEGGEHFSLDPVEVGGYLDLRDEGYGFLRVNGYLPSRDDAYIPVKLTRQYGLRKGDHVTGLSRPAGRNEKNPALLEVHTINGGEPEAARDRRRFEDLTALFPDKKLVLATANDPHNMTVRILDLVSPIGKGQRGIIVSPPKAGKTTVMKEIATAIERHNPEVTLMVLLIDERPEEVTDMRRTVKGEVIASTFDRPSEEHTQVAELALEKAKRLVEMGNDVVIILDGITRLSRAYNLAAPPSGRILSGGIDAGALYPPKKFFGAARNCEEGGSLTILATALVETNSRMDEAIFEEFKGTGNMELRLDRRLAERRVYPAIDVDASSTRHEELLFDRKQLQQVWKLRRVLSGLADGGSAAPGLELLMDRLKTFKTNEEFLNEIGKQP